MKLKRLDGTAEPVIEAGFSFTVSPDDQWLIFFQRTQAPDRPEVHYLYGHLRVMNLRSGEVHEFTVSEDEGPHPMHGPSAEASWARDSSMCVVPPPPVQDNRIVIKFAKGGKPTVALLKNPLHRRRNDPPPEQVQLPEELTCSDCSPQFNNIELLKKHIPKDVGFAGPNERGYQIVSPDGSKIYYQKGPQGKRGTPDTNWETTLYEIDVKTGKERALVAHTGLGATISQLRPSPDGKKLAYQVTTGGNFISVPEINVLDLETGKVEYIALGGGTMHWTSTSDKLFFYRRWLEGGHGDYLWVAEFGKADQPAPPPASPAGNKTP